jgi:serine/threonine protein kinase
LLVISFPDFGLLLGRFVALKICAAASGPGETDLLYRLKHGNKESQSLSYTQDILDQFEHESSNGTHKVLVLEPLGRTLAEFIDRSPADKAFEGAPRVSFVKHISRQLILGLNHIHSCGIVHRGM